MRSSELWDFSKITSARSKRQTGFGLRVLALDSVKLRQVVEAHGYVGVFRSQGLFPCISPQKGVNSDHTASSDSDFSQFPQDFVHIDGASGCLRNS